MSRSIRACRPVVSFCISRRSSKQRRKETVQSNIGRDIPVLLRIAGRQAGEGMCSIVTDNHATILTVLTVLTLYCLAGPAHVCWALNTFLLD